MTVGGTVSDWLYCLMSRRSQSLQNLYSTVNGLLASADRLSQQVAQQMEALNITAQPAAAQKIMKSVGLTPDNSPPVHVRPAPMGTVPSPQVRHQLTYSPSSKPESGTTNLATPPRRAMPTDSGVGAPSITRRRRDSMDGVIFLLFKSNLEVVPSRASH